jgi:uncharacterized protein YdeI (YjbR/CyaY-like superfamily)
MRLDKIFFAIAATEFQVRILPEVRAMVKSPMFFKTPNHFRNWLKDHYASELEVMVGYYKVGSGIPSMTWPESVEEALCYGWIDSVRRRVDDSSYVNRFTPRRPGSIWSLVNVAKVESLMASGRMQSAGLAAFESRRPDRTGIYASEQAHPAVLAASEVQHFQSNHAAWQYFETATPSYKRSVLHWITSAKRSATRARRLEKLIQASQEHRRVPVFL